jgi:hypothetical protein
MRMPANSITDARIEPGNVGAEHLPERGEREIAVVALGEHPDAGEEAHDAAERFGVRIGVDRELAVVARTVPEEVGEPELGREVERA